ncbi:nickel/cobalt transporter [Psychromonas sp. L1A2]|uniref:nickel/cobalt transporter n=1 Tax=Psychromonas sp. L1A2 TaxID=2686356 RepID=UPI00191591F0|nr:hypothetical protein [Psychromonas sp. L1A2]
MHWQKEINEQIIELLYSTQTQLLASGFSLISAAFIYGVLHSLGPDHGKLIVTTYLSTHPTKVKISLILTVLSALLQAIVAIVVVSILLLLFNSTMREVNNEANHFISLSFYSVVILGSIVIWRNMKTLFKEFYSRPCTGAIMVLLFSNTLGLYWLGIISALFMSVGTALTTSSIAIMTTIGTKLVQGYLSNGDKNNIHFKSKRRKTINTLIKLTGGILLVLMGGILLKSQPVGMSAVF